MKYLVSYECRTGNGVFNGSFEYDAASEPVPTDPDLIGKALEDSARFNQAGMAGLSITAISLAS